MAFFFMSSSVFIPSFYFYYPFPFLCSSMSSLTLSLHYPGLHN
jgi:hypothetical protein